MESVSVPQITTNEVFNPIELEKPFVLEHPEKMNKYSNIVDSIRQSNMDEMVCLTTINLIKTTLESKQCNEPYEELLSDVLGLINNPDKHGFDARSHDSTEEYEYKPTKNRYGGTINDDTIQKIEKCEELIQGGTKLWLIIAFINSNTYSFDCIYKFNMEIYNEARREYVSRLIEKNKASSKQTRATYPISVGKSIKLSEQYNTPYYVWKRE